MTIWRIHFACWMPKAINTNSEYAILIAFLLLQWLHESRLNITVYVYFLSFCVSGMRSTQVQRSPRCEPALHIQHAVRTLQALPVAKVPKQGNDDCNFVYFVADYIYNERRCTNCKHGPCFRETATTFSLASRFFQTSVLFSLQHGILPKISDN